MQYKINIIQRWRDMQRETVVYTNALKSFKNTRLRVCILSYIVSIFSFSFILGAMNYLSAAVEVDL